jgi:hypothetical protein
MPEDRIDFIVPQLRRPVDPPQVPLFTAAARACRTWRITNTRAPAGLDPHIVWQCHPRVLPGSSTVSAHRHLEFGEIDIYLFDQLLRGRFDDRRRQIRQTALKISV